MNFATQIAWQNFFYHLENKKIVNKKGKKINFFCKKVLTIIFFMV